MINNRIWPVNMVIKFLISYFLGGPFDEDIAFVFLKQKSLQISQSVSHSEEIQELT